MKQLKKLINLDSRIWIDNLLGEYDKIILLPDDNETQNILICKTLEKKLLTYQVNEKNIEKAKWLLISLTQYSDTAVYAKKIISKDIMDDIISLYCMYEFTDKIIIGSFTQPFGRKLQNLINSGFANEEEIIEFILLRNV